MKKSNEDNRMRVWAVLALMVLASPDVSAQGLFQKAKQAVKNAGNTLKENVKGVVENSARLMVGYPDKQQENDGQQTKPSDSNGADGQGSDPDDGKGGGPPRKPDVAKVTLDFELNWEAVSDVYDGVFSVKVPGYPVRYRFYKVKTGEQVSHEWSAYQEPRFNNGVCMVQSLSGSKRWYILKTTGDSIALDPAIRTAGNFQDGLAVVSASGLAVGKWFVNDKGQKVYASLKPGSLVAYPLRGGTRRMIETEDGFGYMDANGTVVIAPKYKKARSFSGDVAVVSDTGVEWKTIDLNGNTLAKVPKQYVGWGGPDMYFVNHACMVWNSETDKVDIVTPQFQVKASYDQGSGFFVAPIMEDAIGLVKNSDWKTPRYCNTTGKLLDGNPYYVYKDRNGAEVTVAPSLGNADAPGYDRWYVPYWGNTGIMTTYVPLVHQYDLIMVGTSVTPYESQYMAPSGFCAEGYSKAVMRTVKGEGELGLTGDTYKELESHTVFINTKGKAVLELVGTPAEE